MTASAIAARYGSIAPAYDRLWASPLVAFARPLIDTLSIQPGEQVVDLGAGTGSVARESSDRTFALDRTEGMVRLAAARGLPSVVCDARAVPLKANSVDVVQSTFVLQHIPTPGVVLREAHRILKLGGRCGTATWTPDHGEEGGAYAIFDEVVARFDLPPEPPRIATWHDRVDTPNKVLRHARRAGFGQVDARVVPVSYTWPLEAFVEWMTSFGATGRRIALMPARGEVARTLTNALAGATDKDLTWESQIVLMIAVR